MHSPKAVTSPPLETMESSLMLRRPSWRPKFVLLVPFGHLSATN